MPTWPAQEIVRGMLLSKFPDHGFLGEEGGSTGKADAEYRWVVDPLDGTTNYIHQNPHYCTSVGLERRGQLVCGAVYDPILKECFTAEAGQGAFLNGKPLAVSKVTDVGDALTVVSFPSHLEPGARELEEFGRVVGACQAVRRTGSAALNLSYVAAGRFRFLLGRQSQTVGRRPPAHCSCWKPGARSPITMANRSAWTSRGLWLRPRSALNDQMLRLIDRKSAA